MVRKTRRKIKKNSSLMVWVFVVLFLLIVISIAVILTLNNGFDPNTNKSFFVSDDSKYVIESYLKSSGEDGEPMSSYDVYYHDGNAITKHEAYFEFIDEELAKNALSRYQTLQGDDIATVALNGRFIVLTASPEQYDGLTLELIRQLDETESSDVDDSVENVDQ